MFYLLTVCSVFSLKSLNYCIERLRSYPLPFLPRKSIGDLTCNYIFKRLCPHEPRTFLFTRLGLGWMSEFMFWFRVDGGKIRVKKLQFRKYPDSYRWGGAWGLSVWLPIYKILFRQSSKAETQSSAWYLTRRRLRSARCQQQQQQILLKIGK